MQRNFKTKTIAILGRNHTESFRALLKVMNFCNCIVVLRVWMLGCSDTYHV